MSNNPVTQKVEAEGPVQGHLQLHRVFEVSLKNK